MAVDGKRTQQRLKTNRMRLLVLEMWESGQKSSAIKRALKAGGYGDYSTTRITKIIGEEYDRIASERRTLGERIFDQHLQQLDMVIRANTSVLTTPCPRCQGRGHVGQDPDRQEGVNIVCENCSGDGKHHSARDRAAASKEFRQAIAERNRMLGFYAPEKFAWTTPDGEGIDFTADLRHLSEEDLDAEFARVNDAVKASNREDEIIRALDSGELALEPEPADSDGG